jgi:ABC-type glycerol-3-phosphate transport system substrate-binding protein
MKSISSSSSNLQQLIGARWAFHGRSVVRRRGFDLFRIAALLVLAAGCSKPNPSAVAAAHSQLFPADPLKTEWETAMAALQTNGYIVAETALYKMQRENPNAQQLQAIDETLRALNEQIIAAANKGDPGANQALQELKKLNPP